MSKRTEDRPVVVMGYSGHAYSVIDILLKSGRVVAGYCNPEEVSKNPFGLEYFGDEKDEQVLARLQGFDFIIAIGDNKVRQRSFERLSGRLSAVNAIDPSAEISPRAELAAGIVVAPSVSINVFSTIGNGVICNTGSVIDHDCVVGPFCHLAPGSVLCGNVTVGAGSFIGANSVVRQGITIGSNVTLGAGCVVVKDIPDGSCMVGNPQRPFVKKT